MTSRYHSRGRRRPSATVIEGLRASFGVGGPELLARVRAARTVDPATITLALERAIASGALDLAMVHARVAELVGANYTGGTTAPGPILTITEVASAAEGWRGARNITG